MLHKCGFRSIMGWSLVPYSKTGCDWSPSGRTCAYAASVVWVAQHTGGNSWSCAKAWADYNLTANQRGTKLQSVSTSLGLILLATVWWLPMLPSWVQSRCRVQLLRSCTYEWVPRNSWLFGTPHPAPSSAPGHSCQWTLLLAVLGQQHHFAVLRTHDEDRQWPLPAAVVWSHLLHQWSTVQFCSPNSPGTTQVGPKLRWLLGGSAWLVSTYDIYYVLKALSKYLLHLG